MTRRHHGRVRRVVSDTFWTAAGLTYYGFRLLILPISLAQYTRRQIIKNSRKDRRVYLASETDHPLPLPLRRRFNVSDPNLPLSDQSNSRLMTLPYEVRHKIWQFAVAEDWTIDVAYDHGQPRLRYCLVPEDETAVQRTEFGDTFEYLWQKRFQNLAEAEALPKGSNPAFTLIRTCRQVYKECMPLIYSRNTFRFVDMDTLCFFNQGLRRQWAARIKSLSMFLQFDWTRLRSPDWKSAWFQIATWMTGLTHLKIDVQVISRSDWAEYYMFIDIAQISGLESFEMNYFCYLSRFIRSMKPKSSVKKLEEMVKRPRGSKIPARAQLELKSILFAEARASQLADV